MDTDQDSTQRARLADAMNQRRLNLGLLWKDIAARAHITPETLRQVRFGVTQMRDTTERRLEDALEWAHGSIETVMAGGDPTPASENPTPEGPSGQMSGEGPLRADEVLMWHPHEKSGGLVYALLITDKQVLPTAVFHVGDPIEWVVSELRRLGELATLSGIGHEESERQN